MLPHLSAYRWLLDPELHLSACSSYTAPICGSKQHPQQYCSCENSSKFQAVPYLHELQGHCMMQANLQVGRCSLTEGHTSHESSASLTEAKRHLGAAGGTGIGNIKPSSVNVDAYSYLWDKKYLAGSFRLCSQVRIWSKESPCSTQGCIHMLE